MRVRLDLFIVLVVVLFSMSCSKFDDVEEKFDRPIAPELRGVLVVSGLFIVLFIFIPTPIISLAEVAALALFPG